MYVCTTTNGQAMGKLRGIVLTPELRSVIDAVLALQQQQPPASSSRVVGGANDDDDGYPAKTTTTTISSMSMSPESAAREARREMSSRGSSTSWSNDAGEAKSAVRSAMSSSSSSSSATLSLSALGPIRFLIDNSLNNSTLLLELEGAIRNSSLSFFSDDSNEKSPDDGLPTSTSSDVDVVDRTAFEKRLAKLRLRDEERSYGRLTTNLRNRSSMIGDDDVTAKSMTYAASVGLNMIVAPVTFGVFMYFFAGGIFGRFFDVDDDEGGGDRSRSRGGDGVDVRRVIAGVVSGCFMLFVEMILFVIRSHEIDASSTRKGRRSENRANPFGYTQKSMARVYVRDD